MRLRPVLAASGRRNSSVCVRWGPTGLPPLPSHLTLWGRQSHNYPAPSPAPRSRVTLNRPKLKREHAFLQGESEDFSMAASSPPSFGFSSYWLYFLLSPLKEASPWAVLPPAQAALPPLSSLTGKKAPLHCVTRDTGSLRTDRCTWGRAMRPASLGEPTRGCSETF